MKKSKFDSCVHKNKHGKDSFYNHSACPVCHWVAPQLRKNLKAKGKNFIIDFFWLTFDGSQCYTTFDGRNEGGQWKKHKGKAILNSNFCIIKKITEKAE